MRVVERDFHKVTSSCFLFSKWYASHCREPEKVVEHSAIKINEHFLWVCYDKLNERKIPGF